MNRITTFTAAIVLLLSQSGCSPAEHNAAETHAADTPSVSLTGAQWLVTEIAGASIENSISVSLSFDEDGRVSGSSGCNRYFAGYKVDNNKMTFGPVAGTKMMCGPAAMNVEHSFLSLLHKAATFSASNTGGLVIAAKNGDAIKAVRSDHSFNE